MAVLVMDTATQILAVAVGGSDSSSIASAGSTVLRGHSRLLQPTIAQVMQTLGLDVHSLTRIGVGLGPGSYTGVRLAVSTAKSMAYALQIPLAPISTLWALAEAAAPHHATQPTFVLTLLNARRQRAFGAIYRKAESTWDCLVPAQVRLVSDWVDVFSDIAGDDGRGMRLAVHDFAANDELLSTLHHGSFDGIVTLRDLTGALGPALHRIASAADATLFTGEAVHDIEPEYALPVEAEVKLEQKGGA